MKIIISGGKGGLKDYWKHIDRAIEYAHTQIPVEKIKTVVSFDKLVSMWAKDKKFKVKEFFPDWLDTDVEDVILKVGKDNIQYNALAAKNRDVLAAKYANGGIFIYSEGCYLDHIIELMKEKTKNVVVYEI